MAKLIRFGVSIEKSLAGKFDVLIKEKDLDNRSEAIRGLIRRELVKSDWEKNRKVAGALVFIYDHHKHDLSHKLTHLQHDHQKIIISSQHIHLDHNNCLEILAVRGNSRSAKKLEEAIRSIKGVKHVSLTMSCTGKSI